MLDEFYKFNNQNLSISIDTQLLSNRHYMIQHNLFLFVNDSILSKAWKFFYFFAEKFILMEAPLIMADDD